jgi:hypothetical protein
MSFWPHVAQISPQLSAPREKLGKPALVYVFFFSNWGTPTIVYRYAASVKVDIQNIIKILKEK